MVPKFSAARFLPFWADMGPFLVIFLVLEVRLSAALGPLETGEQKNLLPHNF